MSERLAVIIAGPNGAGKTTFAQSYLPVALGLRRFINADLIALGLSPFDPEREAVRAGKLMLAEIAACVREGASFAVETTLSARLYARLIPEWKSVGYRVQMVFLSLPSAEMAVARVQTRVRAGGHAVPEATVRRRFATGQDLFEKLYKPLADEWFLYDNAGSIPVLREHRENQ